MNQELPQAILFDPERHRRGRLGLEDAYGDIVRHAFERLRIAAPGWPVSWPTTTAWSAAETYDLSLVPSTHYGPSETRASSWP